MANRATANAPGYKGRLSQRERDQAVNTCSSRFANASGWLP
jgi:hypothetical protein